MGAPAETIVYFHGAESPLSNFRPAAIAVDGRAFANTEQAFMARKALQFGDAAAYEAICAEPAPLAAKRLGRQVRNYDDAVWARERERHMREVCLAKFRQHADLRRALLATGAAVLAEAAPRDVVWGIGRG